MSLAPDTQRLLEVRRVSKRFPGVQALRDVDMRLDEGEVLAVIGENGAGKSTLMKILAGVQSHDSGEILLRGEEVSIGSVREATTRGIALIHQELNLSDNLDVGANIFLGREPQTLGLIHKRKIAEESARHLDRVGLDCSPRTIASSLAIGQQQLVEIAKALSADARILIMDEPTSSLSLRETTRLFEVIRDLRARGVSIVYISHRLSEVKEIADRVTVLRDGENAGELEREEIEHDNMVSLMVGRDVSQFYVHGNRTTGDSLLEVENLRVPGSAHHPLSFTVKAGEIVGIAGLVGAGRTETLQALFGVDRAEGGVIRIDGKEVAIRAPIDAIRAGMALVPEDRKAAGLILEMTVRENISLARLRQDQVLGMLHGAAERRVCSEMIESLGVKTPSSEQIVQYLSGGNQQKVVLAKWLAMNPRILLLDEPTRGIDVGAKEEIYRTMEQIAESGAAVIFVSSEMEEILGMSDRVLVMHEGRISGSLNGDELSDESVMHLATGSRKAS